METESLIRESRADALESVLGFETDTGKEQFRRQVRQRTANLGLLTRRQETVLSARATLSEDSIHHLDAVFREIKALEPDLKIFFEKTEVEKESYEQLLFSGWPSLQVLNTIPLVLLGLSLFKLYVVPALALLTPLFLVLMPYVVLTYWYNLSIPPEKYLKLLMSVLGIQQIDLSNPRTILQGGLTLFSLGNSIYQPIQSALHLQVLNEQLLEKAAVARNLVQAVATLKRLIPCKLSDPLEDLPLNDPHRLFAALWDSPVRLRLVMQRIGDYEVVYRLAGAKQLNPVQWASGSSPCLEIQRGTDPFLPSAIPFTLRLSRQSPHAILTGPNRGGKSSVLRSTLLTVVLAQSFGLAFCEQDGSLRLKPFDWIATGLKLEDRPGSLSMFESEVEFALQILNTATSNPEKVGFVLFDELFHSTNPPDGARTADLFLQKLWKQTTVASFISTHVFDLAKKSHPTIQKLCVPATEHPDGSLEFHYTLKEGVCEVSSVDLILKEKGLLTAES